MARRRLRKAHATLLEEGQGSVHVVEEFELSVQAGDAVHEARAARERARVAEQAAKEAARNAREALGAAVRALIGDDGMSLRDAAEILGVPHQRLQEAWKR